MKNFSVIVLVASLSFMAGAGVTYLSREATWVSDMANQPSIKPQERTFRPPERSVPSDLLGGATGISTEELPAEAGHQEQMGHDHGPSAAASSGHQHDSSSDHQHGSTKAAKPQKKPQPHDYGAAGDGHDHSPHSHGPAKTGEFPAKHSHNMPAGSVHAHDGDTGEGHAHGGQASEPARTLTQKPIKATLVSIKQGEELFNIYCAVCHGNQGQGGMPMEKSLPDIPKFTPQLLRRESDAHMFSMVTSGHGPMPGYAEALMPEERWHVVNYLRTLQNMPTKGEEQNTSKGKGS